ncbi:MAG: DNA-binding response regulator [Cytophagia bacterium]|nr:MAG: DNA-binding response regulator [Runella sp.]TAG24942.1 MAG: DNA-binding response regulator [Cytophagales bacterium]TAG36866.1 MAG: DNA-binding response regulator [Cytophagia bacterium]TAG84417.1 MAG: DNA-binding response regulator [Cytophagales bacterium]
MTRILLIDDHQVVLESLKLLFRSIKNVEVVGMLNDSREAMAFLENHEVDLVISDFHVPHLSGADLTLQIRQAYPALKVLLLTMAEDPPHIREAMQAGVSGYVLKRANKEELETAIEQIMAGKKYFSPAVIEELTASNDATHSDESSVVQHLTEREIEVLKLIALEYSSAEIAQKLFISLSTVETHRRNLFQKLDVKNAIGLTKYAIKHKLVSS